jgi:hypothetical protein
MDVSGIGGSTVNDVSGIGGSTVNGCSWSPGRSRYWPPNSDVLSYIRGMRG